MLAVPAGADASMRLNNRIVHHARQVHYRLLPGIW